jgi:hypothetical protein
MLLADELKVGAHSATYHCEAQPEVVPETQLMREPAHTRPLSPDRRLVASHEAKALGAGQRPWLRNGGAELAVLRRRVSVRDRVRIH